MGGEEGAVVATQCADPELDDSSESAAQVSGAACVRKVYVFSVQAFFSAFPACLRQYCCVELGGSPPRALEMSRVRAVSLGRVLFRVIKFFVGNHRQQLSRQRREYNSLNLFAILLSPFSR